MTGFDNPHITSYWWSEADGRGKGPCPPNHG